MVHDPTGAADGWRGGACGSVFYRGRSGEICAGDADGAKVLSALTVAKMTHAGDSLRRHRCCAGSDGISIRRSPAIAASLFHGSFGHTGFTGTSIWIDPVTDSLCHSADECGASAGARGGGGSLRKPHRHGRGARAYADAGRKRGSRWRASPATTRQYWAAGGECAERTGRHGHRRAGGTRFRELRKQPGQASRLVTNQTGLDAEGKRTIDVLAKLTEWSWMRSSVRSMA